MVKCYFPNSCSNYPRLPIAKLHHSSNSKLPHPFPSDETGYFHPASDSSAGQVVLVHHRGAIITGKVKVKLTC